MAALSVTLDSITLLVTVIVFIVWCGITLVLGITLSLMERDTTGAGTHPDTVQERWRWLGVSFTDSRILSGGSENVTINVGNANCDNL